MGSLLLRLVWRLRLGAVLGQSPAPPELVFTLAARGATLDCPQWGLTPVLEAAQPSTNLKGI